MSERLHRRTGTTLLSEDEPFGLELGDTIARPTIAYETYGRLDKRRGNAVLVCHALTGSAHAAGIDDTGRTGWWDPLIGPGRALDTSRYFVICSNVLGSCYGSTGPRSIDPATGHAHGEAFPTVTIRDMVRAQRRLLDHLGIERLHAVVGGSMGGMQVLEWGATFADDVELLIPIAIGPAHSAWSIGFNAAAREALALGTAAGDAAAGLRLARKIAMLTYRSSAEFAERFGRTRTTGAPSHADGGFAVESYLEHHGRRLSERFDAETYAVLSRAMDLHDVARGRGELADVLARLRQTTLVVGITSDVLYPEWEQRELARALPNARFQAIDSIYGHDAFLIEFRQLTTIVGGFLAEHAGRCGISLQSTFDYHEAV